jgi:hypothetical protein
MKGKIGGSMQMRGARAAGVTFRGPHQTKRQRKLRFLKQRLDAVAHQPVVMTPRLRKKSQED